MELTLPIHLRRSFNAYLIRHNTIERFLKMKVKYVTWPGLLGAPFAGVSQIVAGDIVGASARMLRPSLVPLD